MFGLGEFVYSIGSPVLFAQQSGSRRGRPAASEAAAGYGGAAIAARVSPAHSADSSQRRRAD